MISAGDHPLLYPSFSASLNLPFPST